MKKHISKRLLSVLLAALLVLTTIPFAAFNASAASESKINSLKSAISTYESSVKTGTIYKNMEKAYVAYVKANTYVDSYEYGTNKVTDAQIDSVISDMTLTPWSISFNAPAYFYNNVANGGYSNVIYNGHDDNGTYMSLNGTGDTECGAMYLRHFTPKNIVFAYDGTNEIYGPAMVETKSYKKTNVNNTKYIRNLYPNTTNITFKNSMWYGYWDGNTVSSAWKYWYNTYTNDQFSATSTEKLSGGQGNTGTKRYWWNMIKYTGSGSSTSGTGNATDYYDTIPTMSFTVKVRYDLSVGGSNKSASANMDHSDTNWFIINYKPIKDTLDFYASQLSSLNIKNYSESGGLTELMQNIDKLTAFNPMDSKYTYSSNVANAVTAVANDIRSLIDNYSSASIGAQNGTAYASLRAAENRKTNAPKYTDRSATNYDAKGIYALGNSDAFYEETSWSNFENAFENAQAVFDAVAAAGTYGNFDTAKITALENGYDNLEYGSRAADFTSVDNAKSYVVDELANRKYSVDTLNGVKDKLTSASEFPYLNNTDRTIMYQKAQFDTVQAAIEAEALKIRALVENKEVDQDIDTLDRTIEKINAEIPDLDAQKGYPEALEEITEYYGTKDVTGFDTSVYKADKYSGFRYENQSSIDTKVTELLEALAEYQDKQEYATYTLTVKYADGTVYSTADYAYGTTITVNSPTGEAVPWLYAYESTTGNKAGQQVERYLETADAIDITILGDTTLTVMEKSDTTSTAVKVTYKIRYAGDKVENDPNETWTYTVEYYENGETVDPAAIELPSIAFYTLDEEKLPQPFEATEDTTVFLTYKIDDRPYYLIQVNYDDYNFTEVYYKGLVNLDEDYISSECTDLNNDGEAAYFVQMDDYVTVNGEVVDTITLPDGTEYDVSNGISVDDVPNIVGAYEDSAISVDPDGNDRTQEEIDALYASAPKFCTKIWNGAGFNFRAYRDNVILPVSQNAIDTFHFDCFLSNGTEDGAAIMVDNYQDTGSAVRIYSNYTLPEGATAVEHGILLSYGKDAAPSSYDLTLNNALNYGTTGVLRQKFEKHVEGNYYDMDVKYEKIKAGGTHILNMKYRAYVSYKLEGEKDIHILYSDVKTTGSGVVLN